MSSQFHSPPSSILIIGAGVFGLSTAHALLSNPRYNDTAVTLLDAYVPPPSSNGTTSTASSSAPGASFASGSVADGAKLETESKLLTASLDSSRIVRADYAKAAYAQLAGQAQKRWRKGWPYDDAEDEGGDGAEAGRTNGQQTPQSVHAPKEQQAHNNGTKQQLPPQVYHASTLIVTANHANHANSNPRAAEYVASSIANVQRLQGRDGVQELHSRAEIRKVLYGESSTSGHSGGESDEDAAIGDFGYQNHLSAWADASGSMAEFRRRVQRLSERRQKDGHAPFTWRQGHAERLLFGAAEGVHGAQDTAETSRNGSVARDRPAADSQSTPASHSHVVLGVVLSSGETISAALTILAAGAWSAALLPASLGVRVQARGQPLAYVELTETERRELAGKPVLLNIGSATFTMPPPAEGAAGASRPGILKTAQHSWGYARNVHVTNTEPIAGDAGARASNGATADNTSKSVCISIPPTSRTFPIPARSQKELLAFVRSVYPAIGARCAGFAATRLCWYADTPTGDFLVAYVPTYGRSVLVATGGSGQGFKFVPLIGESVIGIMEGRWTAGSAEKQGGTPDAEEEEHDRLGRELGHLWRWRSDAEIEEDLRVPGDGTRGGQRGLVCEDDDLGSAG